MTKKEWKKQSDERYEEITTFISNWGILTELGEPDHYVELMMDDHRCIKWNRKLYYIPETCSSFDAEDYEILEYLEDNHHC